jgi:hypothetical protein
VSVYANRLWQLTNKLTRASYKFGEGSDKYQRALGELWAYDIENAKPTKSVAWGWAAVPRGRR